MHALTCNCDIHSQMCYKLNNNTFLRLQFYNIFIYYFNVHIFFLVFSAENNSFRKYFCPIKNHHRCWLATFVAFPRQVSILWRDSPRCLRSMSIALTLWLKYDDLLCHACSENCRTLQCHVCSENCRTLQ